MIVPNYQIIVELVVQFLAVAFPISVVFALASKLAQMFSNAIKGKERIL
ncbi:hypothetical protein [Anaerorhabdus sp.]